MFCAVGQANTHSKQVLALLDIYLTFPVDWMCVSAVTSKERLNSCACTHSPADNIWLLLTRNLGINHDRNGLTRRSQMSCQRRVLYLLGSLQAQLLTRSFDVTADTYTSVNQQLALLLMWLSYLVMHVISYPEMSSWFTNWRTRHHQVNCPLSML